MHTVESYKVRNLSSNVEVHSVKRFDRLYDTACSRSKFSCLNSICFFGSLHDASKQRIALERKFLTQRIAVHLTTENIDVRHGAISIL